MPYDAEDPGLHDSDDAASHGSSEYRPEGPNFDGDPLIRLIGSGKHIWADEHADEYVENLRREDV